MPADYSKPNAIYLYKDPIDEGTERKLRRRIMLNDPMANMHSTKLREMIKNNESVYPYINLDTELYIKHHSLYY